MKKINSPIAKDIIQNLKAGDELLLSGIIYTARDAAHQRLSEAIKRDRGLPIDLKSAVIYYCGPTPAKPGEVIGSCGPTTSKRMDKFTPLLLSKGMAAMIGKGRRSKEIIDAIKKYKAIYLVAVGGAGAYLAQKVKKARVFAYRDLGPEAIYQLHVKDFPLIVGIDSKGRGIYG
jgi:fumarate hydratase subunit beta